MRHILSHSPSFHILLCRVHSLQVSLIFPSLVQDLMVLKLVYVKHKVLSEFTCRINKALSSINSECYIFYRLSQLHLIN